MKLKLLKAEIVILRSQTKGCAERIHFNNAGAALPPDVVVDTVVSYLREEALLGGYEAEVMYAKQIGDVYTSIAKLINAEDDEIALFENASSAWLTAFRGVSFQRGDEIITSEMEYVTNLIGLVDAHKANGVMLKVISNDERGNFPLDELEKAVSPKTKLIAITHISSSGGGVLPVEKIGEIAERHNILYLVDACQSAGQLPLDVRKIKCDMLSVTGRKYLRAPRGTGFLFVKRAIQDELKPLFLDSFAAANVSLSGYNLRQDARRFELYEKNRGLVLGLGKAVDYALHVGIDRIWNRIEFLSSVMRKKLADIPGVIMRDSGEKLSGLITFSVKGMDSSAVKLKLGALGINVSIGASQATPLYMEKSGLDTVVRASVHYYNTEGEIVMFCRELSTIIEQKG
ncbi:aminotransferase class V-fold PLP-dependent enzyme [Arcticibacter sp.]|jgi:selenocysteine lyase/cysteine desulfurase|uniref:aminotransferase class V-fold PLP-dependent enzyme n=1 Tax=Arcticibacter sp. TaxID=1872630 RepID=UPI00388EBB8A